MFGGIPLCEGCVALVKEWKKLQWASTPEWLTSVTVNQQVNHITTLTDRAEKIRQLTDGQRVA